MKNRLLENSHYGATPKLPDNYYPTKIEEVQALLTLKGDKISIKDVFILPYSMSECKNCLVSANGLTLGTFTDLVEMSTKQDLLDFINGKIKQTEQVSSFFDNPYIFMENNGIWEDIILLDCEDVLIEEVGMDEEQSDKLIQDLAVFIISKIASNE